MAHGLTPGLFWRRGLLALAAVFCLAVAAPATAQVSSSDAVGFITTLGNQLVGLINQGVDSPDRRQQLQTVVDRDVDVDGVAQFCLGRFWRIATPAQQQEYQNMFHDVLMRSLTANLGDYQGVTFSVGQVVPANDGGVAVQTTLTRPNNAPNNVQWIVISKGGSLKVADLVVEGASLRLAKRAEYASFLQNNGNSIEALISALKAQAQT